MSYAVCLSGKESAHWVFESLSSYNARAAARWKFQTVRVDEGNFLELLEGDITEHPEYGFIVTRGDICVIDSRGPDD